jgi:hypothetical protein
MNHSQESGERRRDALVAVVREDCDLERFRSERWYRIPARAMGTALGAGTLHEAGALALYQTTSITAGLPGAIELWGEIESIERRVRREIIPSEPDHPSADEEYQVVRVRDVRRLERPITSRRRRRFTFLRTTTDRLLAAEDLNDLIVGDETEEKLWESLKKLGAERRCYMEAGNAVMEVDFALFNGERSLGLLCRENASAPSELSEAGNDEWSILRFTPGELDVAFDECLRAILAMAEQLRARP